MQGYKTNEDSLSELKTNPVVKKIQNYINKWMQHVQRMDRDRLTYLLTPWCRVLLEKLTGLQLVKKFPVFHGTQKFITALTSVRHLSLSGASPIQSIYPHPTSWRCPNIIYPSTPRSPQWSLSFQFPHQDPIHPPLLTHMRHMSSPSHTSRLI